MQVDYNHVHVVCLTGRSEARETTVLLTMSAHMICICHKT